MYEKIVCPDTVGWVVRLSNKSQSQDIVKGDLAFLKDVKEIQVAYVYENITVGKDGKEATYIKRKKNVGIKSAKAAVNLEIYIYDTANKSKALCKIMLNDMRGGKGQFAK
ncbi:hypothetical protein [Chitinophaga sp. HK235]|uniref:hypothetical protein n=1 Tax=Chitinophaga sp. HK235 TaxID=2952571 RepID=UPI001BA8FFCB|nr:hypothetical protein [Chitinophaga sp. HK235]